MGSLSRWLESEAIGQAGPAGRQGEARLQAKLRVVMLGWGGGGGQAWVVAPQSK